MLPNRFSKSFLDSITFKNILNSHLNDALYSELLYISVNIMNLTVKGKTESELKMLIITEAYNLVRDRLQMNISFWTMVQYFNKFMSVEACQSIPSSTFANLDMSNVRIYHCLSEQHRQINSGQTQENKIIKNDIFCICPEKAPKIRKTRTCDICGSISHLKCFNWDEETFICVACVLDSYNIFYSVERSIIDGSVIKYEHVEELELCKDDFDQGKFLIFKFLRIEHEAENKYTIFEMGLPQEGIIKINGTTVKQLIPDAVGQPRRIDTPLRFSLINSTILKPGQNILVIEHVRDTEQLETPSFIFNAKIYTYIKKDAIIEKILSKQLPLYYKNIENEKNLITDTFKELESCVIKVSLVC